MKRKKKKRTNWRKITPSEHRMILDAYYDGVSRRKIIRTFKITESQLYRIIRDDVNAEQGAREE